MAKRNLNRKRRETGREITTPSAYGSHKEMVVSAQDYGLDLGEGQVLCQDDNTFYVTEENRLDNGLADPNRYSKPQLSLEKTE